MSFNKTLLPYYQSFPKMIPFNKRKINIDAGTKCTLQCSGCVRTKWKANGWRIPGKDLTIEQFKKIVNYFDEVGFCGTWSDPIFNKNFIEFLKICKYRNKPVEVSCAASHKPIKWYEEAFAANKNAYWVFGIDGLPEESHKYRKNQDGVKLFNIMLSAKYSGLTVLWQYILFNYNIHNVEEAKKIANFHKLEIMFLESFRQYIDPEIKNVEMNNKNKKGSMGWTITDEETRFKNGLKPKCLLSDRDLSYSPTGHILPCCWVNTDMDDKHLGKLFSDKLHIDNNIDIEEIVNSDEWKSFFLKLEKDSLDNVPETCVDYCQHSLDTNVSCNKMINNEWWQN
tara:strand:- start:4129 stop:5145 length:1017 start_codon:yes stop_codon:yes gene_type:complete